MLASMRRITVVLEFRSPLTACGGQLYVWRRRNQPGDRFPSFTIQRARIESTGRRSAIQRSQCPWRCGSIH